MSVFVSLIKTQSIQTSALLSLIKKKCGAIYLSISLAISLFTIMCTKINHHKSIRMHDCH